MWVARLKITMIKLLIAEEHCVFVHYLKLLKVGLIYSIYDYVITESPKY
jgi:hypothetical protein